MSAEEEWAKLAEAATPGPWVAEEVDDRGFYVGPNCYDVVPITSASPIEDGGPAVGSMDEADARFIAAAREAVPALLAEVTRLRTENERLQRRLFPSQGESYANEVERQRNIIDTFRAAVEKRDADLAAARVEVSQLRAKIEAVSEVCERYRRAGCTIIGIALVTDALAAPLGETPEQEQAK